MGLLTLIQASLFALLLKPWLYLAAAFFQFSVGQGILWVLCAAFFSMVLVYKSSGQGLRGLPLVFVALLLSNLLAWLFALPLVFFVPLSLLLVLGGSRFGDYGKDKSFAADWGLGSLAMVIFASLEGVFGYSVGLSSMLLFFALGILAVILWNSLALEKQGLCPELHGLSRSISLFVLGVVVLSLALGLLLSPSFLQTLVQLAKKVYMGFLDLVMFLIVRPFAWLMGPLFEWAERLEKHEVELDLPEISREKVEIEYGDAPWTPEALAQVSWVSWTLLVVALALVTWLMIRRVLKRNKPEQVSLQVDSRESVFDRGELMGDLKGALQTLIRPLSRLGPYRWYKGTDPVLLIRSLYGRFALRNSKRVPYEACQTPLDYAEVLESSFEERDCEAIHILTGLYNLARYGEQADNEAVSTAQKAFRQIK